MIIDGDAFTFRFELPVGRWIWVPIVSWFSVCMDGVRYISKCFQFLPHPHLHNSWGQSVYLEPIRTYYLVIWPLVWLWFQHVWTFFFGGPVKHPKSSGGPSHHPPCQARDVVASMLLCLWRGDGKKWASNADLKQQQGKSWEIMGMSWNIHGISWNMNGKHLQNL